MLRIRHLWLFLLVTLSFLGCSKGSEGSLSDSKTKMSETSQPQSPQIDNSPKKKPSHKVGVAFDFKEVKLGQTIDEVKAKFQGLHYDKNTSESYLMCSEEHELTKCSKIKNLTIANQVPKSVILIFDDKKLSALILHFDENYFETVQAGLKKKYGEPEISHEQPLNNKLTGVGSKFVGLAWFNLDGDSLSIKNHDENGSSFIPAGTFTMISKAKLDMAQPTEDSDDI